MSLGALIASSARKRGGGAVSPQWVRMSPATYDDQDARMVSDNVLPTGDEWTWCARIKPDIWTSGRLIAALGDDAVFVREQTNVGTVTSAVVYGSTSETANYPVDFSAPDGALILMRQNPSSDPDWNMVTHANGASLGSISWRGTNFTAGSYLQRQYQGSTGRAVFSGWIAEEAFWYTQIGSAASNDITSGNATPLDYNADHYWAWDGDASDTGVVGGGTWTLGPKVTYEARP